MSCNKKGSDIKFAETNDRVYLFVLEEYKALRAEILQTMVNRNTILTFSFASVAGFVTAAALIYKEEPYISYIIVTFVISPIITLFFILWISETRSIIRIATYIKEKIENKVVSYSSEEVEESTVNNTNKKDNYHRLIRWENWLSKKGIASWEDKSFPVLIFIILFQNASWYIGEKFLTIQTYPEKLNFIINKDWLLSLSRIVFVICFLINVGYFWWLHDRGSKLRKRRTKTEKHNFNNN